MSVGQDPLQSWGTLQSGVLLYGLGREKPKYSKDIARITFDVYKQNPRDLFGSLNIRATFYGLYSMSCDIQGLGLKKVLRSETKMFHFPLPTASVPNSFSSAHLHSPSLLALPCGEPPPPALWLPPSHLTASSLPFRELLRWTSTLLQGLGHMLLGISSTLRHVVEGAGQWQQGHLHSY